MNNERPVRVLQIIDTFGMGGAETWLMELLRFWSKSGAVQMEFLLTSGNTGIFDDEAQRLGAKLHHVEYSRRSIANFVRRFRQILRDGCYDAVHDHQDYASGWHFLIGCGLLPRVRVTHVHNPAYQIWNNYGITVTRRLALRIGQALVARHSTHIGGTSQQVIAEYGFHASRYGRISKAALHCGFDSARFRGDANEAKISVCREFGWPRNSKIILFSGRVDQSPEVHHSQNHKNSGFAVSVGIECARGDRSVRMLLAGAGSVAVPILEGRIANAGFADRIQFIGIRYDIPRLMLGSDVLLFPSRGEGLGMVTVEAQAAGLPVIASTAVPRECAVIPELVRFESLERSAAEWAAALLRHASRPRDVVAANQRVATSPFAIEKSARALIEIYMQGLSA